MRRLFMLAPIAPLLAEAVTAQTWLVLLTAQTFPEPAPTPSTKDCAPLTVTCPPGQ